jgi:hypothetical protein
MLYKSTNYLKGDNILENFYITLFNYVIYIFNIERFCSEFFGLKNQTRGHVYIIYMSLNEPLVMLL